MRPGRQTLQEEAGASTNSYSIVHSHWVRPPGPTGSNTTLIILPRPRLPGSSWSMLTYGSETQVLRLHGMATTQPLDEQTRRGSPPPLPMQGPVEFPG